VREPQKTYPGLGCGPPNAQLSFIFRVPIKGRLHKRFRRRQDWKGKNPEKVVILKNGGPRRKEISLGYG